jgi:hypothetical protein
MKVALMRVSRFKAGERVRSVTGWLGTVERVIPQQNGMSQYRVRWDCNGHSGRISPCNLRRADHN